ncbi:MAG TPA: hypothetical protein PLB32_11515, partial [Acidobacteriota bacterium]|nr:hypothetical protein [Acidobacteriota bacterium]
ENSLPYRWSAWLCTRHHRIQSAPMFFPLGPRPTGRGPGAEEEIFNLFFPVVARKALQPTG